MRNNKERLVIDGNAFYEIDIDCINKRKKSEEHARKPGYGQRSMSTARRKPGN